MTSDRKKLLKTLKAILAKTHKGSGCTAAEMATAMSMAQALMTRHQVSLMEVETAEGGTRFIRSYIDLDGCKTLTLWRMKLLAAVGTGCYVEPVYLRPGQYRDKGLIAFLGRPDNVDAAVYLYRALCSAIDSACAEAMPQSLPRGQKAQWGRQFRTGAADTLARRLAEQRLRNERALFSSDSKALVLRDQYDLALFKEKHFGKKVRHFEVSQSCSSIAARRAGAAAGERIPIAGGPGLPGHKQKITS